MKANIWILKAFLQQTIFVLIFILFLPDHHLHHVGLGSHMTSNKETSKVQPLSQVRVNEATLKP